MERGDGSCLLREFVCVCLRRSGDACSGTVGQRIRGSCVPQECVWGWGLICDIKLFRVVDSVCPFRSSQYDDKRNATRNYFFRTEMLHV